MENNGNLPVMTVAQVNRLANEILSNLRVRVIGELDKRFDSSRGYGIGRLSDEEASIDIFIPGSVVFEAKDFLVPGQKIVAEGRLEIYVPYGRFSLNVSHVELYGEGVLQQELEKLKRKLMALGYFDQERKRPLPLFPERIGVITAKKSAAWQDFKTHVVKEYAGLKIVLHDALMQGAYSIDSVTEAFDQLSRENLDLIVLTRGGGSLQDLMSFNSQEIVEAIIKSPFPVVTAIGHEIDLTLSDLAADIYVSTPTKAAQLISNQYAEFKHRLERERENLKRIQLYYKNLPAILENEKARLERVVDSLFETAENRLAGAYQQLQILSPENTLKRGYSITFNKNDKIMREVRKTDKGEIIRTILYKGEFLATINECLEE